MVTPPLPISSAGQITPVKSVEIAPLKEAFVIDSEDRVNWLLRKLANIEAEKARVKAQAQAMLHDIDAEDRSLREHFLPQLQSYMLEQLGVESIDDLAGKKGKLKKFLQGNVQFRTTPKRIVFKADPVTEEEAFVWCRTWLSSAIITVTTTTLDKAAYIETFEQTGEDMPGIEIIPAEEKMSISFSKFATTGDKTSATD